MNICKFLAEEAGSRRKAEALVRDGVVVVNNKPAVLGQEVSVSDDIRIKGRRIKRTDDSVYFLLNKPPGYTCTNRHFKGEKNVFDLIPFKGKLFIAGRLDKESRGLVLLTNDGDWADQMMHPRYGHEKIYHVLIKGRGKREEGREGVIKRLKAGVDIGDGDGVVRAARIKSIGPWKFELVLTEGKKRQIRRMFSAIGCKVEDLQRIQVGDYRLGNLKEGCYTRLNICDPSITLRN